MKKIGIILILLVLSLSCKTKQLDKKGIKKKLEKSISKGKKSPTFKNYISNKNEYYSLKTFKGRYVYIQIWATWCGPCKRDAPFFNELFTSYQGKNIAFISISVDDITRIASRELTVETTWKNTIEKYKILGLQLLANKSWKSEFMIDYNVVSIPRFILIDPKGNIVSANAPRPSQIDALKKIFNDEGI